MARAHAFFAGILLSHLAAFAYGADAPAARSALADRLGDTASASGFTVKYASLLVEADALAVSVPPDIPLSALLKRVNYVIAPGGAGASTLYVTGIKGTPSAAAAPTPGVRTAAEAFQPAGGPNPGQALASTADGIEEIITDLAMQGAASREHDPALRQSLTDDGLSEIIRDPSERSEAGPTAPARRVHLTTDDGIEETVSLPDGGT